MRMDGKIYDLRYIDWGDLQAEILVWFGTFLIHWTGRPARGRNFTRPSARRKRNATPHTDLGQCPANVKRHGGIKRLHFRIMRFSDDAFE